MSLSELRRRGLEAELRTAFPIACFGRASEASSVQEQELQMIADSVPEEDLFVAAPSVPGVFIVDRGLQLTATSDEAAKWELLCPHALRIAVVSVAILVLDDPGESATARLHSSATGWLVVHASLLCGGEAGKAGHIGVVVQRAQSSDVTSLRMRLHGLTAREREVTSLLIRGVATDDIAAQLAVSRQTLRDHMKSIYRKAGVTARHQLIALYAGHARPSPGQPRRQSRSEPDASGGAQTPRAPHRPSRRRIAMRARRRWR